MTRFARGGPSNKKKLQEASSWSQLQDSRRKNACDKRNAISADSNELSWKRSNQGKKTGMVSKTHYGVSQAGTSFMSDRPNQRSGMRPWADSSTRGVEEDDDTDIIVPLKQDTEPKGLAAELEQLKKSTPNLTVEEQQEIGAVIKKEQSRERRRVKRVQQRHESTICYNCRGVGHDMASCPKATKSREADGAGVCFKCGSTEHTIARCRVKLPPGEFPYAKCFICGEQGHLSNKCPDNPRGLYPNGGCCKLCGSVEHFKKDCPELQKQQGITSVTLGRWSTSQSVDEETVESAEKEIPVKKKPKVVKF